MAQRRLNFQLARRFAEPGRFVFLDESGAKTNMTRLDGRAPGGQRCVDATPHGHWKTLTLLGAIGAGGVLHGATMVVDGPIDGVLFLAWVRRWLAPSLRPGQVVVMDNLASHKVAGVREAIEAVGCELWYLPPYSPDLNPIEKLWSKVKAWLRRVGESTVAGLIRAIADALQAVDEQECGNYFKACGYTDSN